MPSQPDGVPAEFGLIARHFRPLAGPGALDLLDDAAVVMPPPGRELVITTDAIVEGVHFLPSDPPFTVAQKLVRVSLSDLAAMGATPWAYLTTVSVPRGTPAAWWEGFAAGLAADQAAFGLILLGGDTTSTPGPISLTATLLGHVAPGQALTRAGARAGDDIWGDGHDRRRARSAYGHCAARSPTRTAFLPAAIACPRPGWVPRCMASSAPAWTCRTG